MAVAALVSVVSGAGFPIGATPSAVAGSPGWSVVPSANPLRPAFGALHAVACSAPTNCLVAGSAPGVDMDNVTRPVVGHLSGDAGQVIPAPFPPGTTGPSSRSRLLGIACPTASRCFAVGTFAAGSGASTLIEQWDGTSWSVASSSNPPSARGGVLNSIACPTSTTCFAVGGAFVGSTGKPIVAQWDGTSWAFVSNPAGPAGQTVAVLSSVACPAAVTCFAVGHSVVAGSYSTLVERWDGAGWSILPSPNPTGATSLDLSAVSCGAASSCFSVGRFADKTAVAY